MVSDDGEYTTSFDSVACELDLSDAESAVTEYQYAIGTTAGGTDVVNWTSGYQPLQ